MQIFLAGGESRHWLQAPLIEDNDAGILSKPSHVPEIQGGRELAQKAIGGIFSNADLSSGQYDIPSLHRSDVIRGGFSSNGIDNAVKNWRPFILESFFYADSETEKLLPHFGDFLLDSGAFTFMQSSKTHVVWEDYIERYADFINRNNVEKFFELDIDSVVGYDKVLEYRAMLEKLTNKQCIPVWHISRGMENFYEMCRMYPYVALGGIVGERRGGTKYKQYHAMFPTFIKIAHQHGCKIHGLGYTDLSGLAINHFDSVDSTAWTTGNRFGFIYQFNGKTMIKHDVPKGKRLADSRKVAEINYLEWIKFQRWAISNFKKKFATPFYKKLRRFLI